MSNARSLSSCSNTGNFVAGFLNKFLCWAEWIRSCQKAANACSKPGRCPDRAAEPVQAARQWADCQASRKENDHPGQTTRIRSATPCRGNRSPAIFLHAARTASDPPEDLRDAPDAFRRDEFQSPLQN